MDETLHRVRVLRDRIKDLLDRERQRIRGEIRAYPTPIPRCDQQFNHLIDRRERLSAELARLEDATAPGAAASDAGEDLLAFIDASRCLDDESKQGLKVALCEALVDPERGSSAAEAQARTGQERLSPRG